MLLKLERQNAGSAAEIWMARVELTSRQSASGPEMARAKNQVGAEEVAAAGAEPRRSINNGYESSSPTQCDTISWKWKFTEGPLWALKTLHTAWRSVSV